MSETATAATVRPGVGPASGKLRGVVVAHAASRPTAASVNAMRAVRAADRAPSLPVVIELRGDLCERGGCTACLQEAVPPVDAILPGLHHCRLCSCWVGA